MHNLNKLVFEQAKEQGSVITKLTFWEPKSRWKVTPLTHLENYFNLLSKEDLQNGVIGLHIQPYVYYYQTPLYIPYLDVEHPGKHHESIQANIDTAQNLFYLFDLQGIARNMVISLTGNGFRFNLPWLIPYPYTKAFLAMVSDNTRFPGIDKAPQTGTNKFVRTFAYRGDTRQAKTAENIHIHFLENASDILKLNERHYRRLIQGKPDINDYYKALPKIIPREFPPESFMEILREYDLSIRLKSTIAIPISVSPRKNFQVNWDQIYKYIEDCGIIHNVYPWEGFEIIKLNSCPECGESEGSPYITPYGKLKCYRATCEAGQGEGLMPSDWVDGYRRISTESAVEETNLPSLTLEEARKMNRDTIRDAILTGESVGINTTPGVGKTHEALEQAVPASQDKIVLYTAPTKELANEAYQIANAIAQRLGIPVNIMELVGRDGENCTDIDSVNNVAERGFTPAYIICADCHSRNNCLYLQQFEEVAKQNFICTTHDMAVHHEKRINPEIWIIDESPLNQFFETTEVGQDQMDEMRDEETADVRPLFDEIKRVAFEAAAHLDKYDQARIYSKVTPPGQWEDAPILENITPVTTKYFQNHLLPLNMSLHHANNPDNEFVWQHNVYKKNLDLQTIRFWDRLIHNDNDALAYIKVSTARQGTSISYNTMQYKPLRFENCQVIHLDGTMFKPEIDELFPECKITDIQVNLSDTLKIHVKSARGITLMRKLDIQKKEADMLYLLGLLPDTAREVLLITHKFIERYALDMAQRLRPDLHLEVIHFWGSRGINQYKDFDACIAYGTPTVNAGGVEDKAMALFEDADDMSKWKTSLGRRDLTQAIHRIRPVNGKKTIIVMGTYWPTEYLGFPDQQFDLMRKGNNYDEAKDRLKQFAQKYGFMDKSVAMLLGVATRNDKAALFKVQQTISRELGGGSELAFTLIDMYKSECQFQGTPPAIFLADGKAWKQLVDALHAETGLFYMSHKAKGAGRESLALGTVEAVRNFFALIGTHFDESQYRSFV